MYIIQYCVCVSISQNPCGCCVVPLSSAGHILGTTHNDMIFVHDRITVTHKYIDRSVLRCRYAATDVFYDSLLCPMFIAVKCAYCCALRALCNDQTLFCSGESDAPGVVYPTRGATFFRFFFRLGCTFHCPSINGARNFTEYIYDCTRTFCLRGISGVCIHNVTFIFIVIVVRQVCIIYFYHAI